MDRLIDRKLPGGRSVAQAIFAPLERSDQRLEFVDVGARNGSFLLPPSYAKHCRITGFEPNLVEYEKLVRGRTDAMVAGLKEPPFKDRKYYPYAVWSENTRRTLYLTVGPGAVSLMGSADEAMASNMWRPSDGGKNYLERHQKLTGTDTVDCVALDRIWDMPDGLIDILKLDVEGAELEALRGAKKLLAQQRVLFIFSEFLFVPYYKDRVTLGHQQVFLDELGYRLISLKLDHDSYNWRPTAIRPENDRWLTYAGDAVFVIDPDRNALIPDTMYRLGLACIAMGFGAFGLNLMRETGKLPPADIAAIEAAANRPSLQRRLQRAWVKAPRHVYRGLRALGLRT